MIANEIGERLARVDELLQTVQADDSDRRLVWIESGLAMKHVPMGSVERVLLAGLYNNLAGLRPTVLSETQAGGFFPGVQRVVYVALQRLSQRGEIIGPRVLWGEVLETAVEFFPQWHQGEQPLSNSTRKDLRLRFHDITTLRPRVEHLERALRVYAEREERLVQIYGQFEEEWRAKRDKGPGFNDGSFFPALNQNALASFHHPPV